MVFYFLFFIFSVIFIEGVTEIIVKSSIFSPLREKLQNKNFIGELLSCGHCFSVWVAIIPSVYLLIYLIFSGFIIESLFAFLPSVVILHRVSNYLHNFMDKFVDKFYSKNHYNNNPERFLKRS